jgi:squalene-hopene/tetraprenyl-beta-curcumene cyclase
MTNIELLKKNDESPKFYQEYPKLFNSYYNIDAKKLSVLSEAGYYYYHSILNLDHLIDNGEFKEIPKMLTLQEESIKLLTSIYGVDSSFWGFWNKRKKEYFEAVKIEKSLAQKDQVDFQIYEDLADKKSAFGKIAIDSLYTLDKEKDSEVYQKLLLSHKYFSVGFQLYDDVKDFKEDFEKRQFNFAIYELKNAIDFHKYKEDVNTLNKLLFIKGVGQEILTKSIQQFEKAISILSTLKVQSKWLETVEEMKNIIINYLDATNGYLATLKARIKIKNQQENAYPFFKYEIARDNKIKKALDFIKSDFLQNYANLKHIMYLGNLEGFKNESQIHISDTFQRALINDCFITVANNYNINISNFLKKECEYLINLRNRDKIGGWSYFPTVQEIAADIDDLGQIIQFFVFSSQSQFIDDYCKDAICTALSERVISNGGIETWIIPKLNQTSIQSKQEHFNSTKWGKGPDVEVVANFIYSLVILNKTQYDNVIKKSIQYILKQQNDKGYWKSRWYYGNYYGTYVCLKLLKEFEKDSSNEIQKALNYLINTQNKDGGFSMYGNEKSDPLSTSFSILGLKLFFDKNSDVIDKAMKYLDGKQNVNGSWLAVDFIKPKVSEPYKSETLTTAYVLKAICS